MNKKIGECINDWIFFVSGIHEVSKKTGDSFKISVFLNFSLHFNSLWGIMFGEEFTVCIQALLYKKEKPNK